LPINETMMLPTWLIEAGVYHDEADLLLREIRRQGMTGSIVPHNALRAGAESVAAGCPDEVRGFVTGMLKAVSWRPDPIFMVDVCASDGRLWLVELNGFSCSWLYQCDLPSVVGRASELAVRQWTSSLGRPTASGLHGR
jgi:hypothetical protein